MAAKSIRPIVLSGLQLATVNRMSKNVESAAGVKRYGKTMLVDTPICNFGLKAPDFELISHDGKSYSRDGLAGSNGLLIAFICNHCPYVKAIIENFVLDAKRLQTNGVQTVAIMPNNYITHPADNPERMGNLLRNTTLGFHI